MAAGGNFDRTPDPPRTRGVSVRSRLRPLAVSVALLVMLASVVVSRPAAADVVEFSFGASDFYVPRPADASDQVGVYRLLTTYDLDAGGHGDLIGENCRFTVMAANEDSVHENNFGAIVTGGNETDVYDTESRPNVDVTTLEDATLVLGPTIELSNVMLPNPDGRVGTSVQYTVIVACGSDEPAPTLDAVSIEPASLELAGPDVVDFTVSVHATGTFDEPILVTVDEPGASCTTRVPAGASFPWQTTCPVSIEEDTVIGVTATATVDGQTQTKTDEATVTVKAEPPELDITIQPANLDLSQEGEVEFFVVVTAAGLRSGPITVEVDEPADGCGGTILESDELPWEKPCVGRVTEDTAVVATAQGTIGGLRLFAEAVSVIDVDTPDTPTPDSAAVSGRVFADVDADGGYDAGERGVPGVVVTLDGAPTTTDADGRYRFDTTAGVRTVAIEPSSLPTGAQVSRPSIRVDLDAGETAQVDFPVSEPVQSGIALSTESPELRVGETIEVTIDVTEPGTSEVLVALEFGPGLVAEITEIPVVPGTPAAVEVTGNETGATFVRGTLPGGASDTLELSVVDTASPDHIQGHVYVDRNRNGSFDAGDLSVPDDQRWAVTVEYSSESLLTSAAAGFRSGGLFASGLFTVQADRSFVVPVKAGRFDVDAPDVGTYVLTAGRLGADGDALDPGNVMPSSGAIPGEVVVVVATTGRGHLVDFMVPGEGDSTISGRVFADVDGDCVLDDDEETIVGVGVRLQSEGRDEETVTGSADGTGRGNYRFFADAGSYLISLDPTVLGPITLPDCAASSIQVVLDEGTSYETVDFPIASAPLGRIGGTVWCDLNGDNKRHPLEKEIPGVTVVLSGDSGMRQQTLTQSGGGFEFSGLLPGSYRMEIEPGSLDAVSFADEQPVEIELGLGEHRLEPLALCQADQIPGVVFGDANGNGVQDEGEDGISGVLVELDGPDGFTDSTRTDGTGRFTFPSASNASTSQASLPTGTHVIRVSDEIEVGGTDLRLTSSGAVEVDVAPGVVTNAPVAFGYGRGTSFFSWWPALAGSLLVLAGLGWLVWRAWLRTQIIPTPSVPPIAGPGAMPVGPTPYRGARPFGPSTIVLPGRARDVRALESLTYSNRIVVVYGPTGAGKSSLIEAGYVHGLDATDFEVLPTARFQLGPGGAAHANGNLFTFGLISYLARTTSPDALSIADYLRSRDPVVDELGLEKARVIVIDEFQEMFRLYRGTSAVGQRGAFFDEIEEALDADPLVRFVFCVDEDEMGELEPYIDRFGPHIVSEYRVEPLAAAEALEAVTAPAESIGREIEPAAATALVDNARTVWAEHAGHRIEVESDRVDMLALQVSAEATWRHADDGPIGVGDVLDWEDGDAALRALYDDAVKRLEPAVDGQRLRSWCEHTLITPDGHRAAVPAGDLSGAGVSGQVIEGLLDAGILIEACRGDLRWYELAHDRLIEAIRRSNRMRRETELIGVSAGLLSAASRMWIMHGRSRTDLLEGEQLEAAERWAAAYPHNVGLDERAYLEASIAAAQADVRTSPGPSAP